MRQLEKLEKYVILPNVGFYGGYVHDGKDIMLCNDHDEDVEYDLKVTQKIVDNVLITDLERKYSIRGSKKVSEVSHQEVELEEGQLLVYVEGTGFTIPEYKMCVVDEAIKQYELLKGIGANDTKGNKEEGSAAH